MSETVFTRAIEAADRAAALHEAVGILQEGNKDECTFAAAPESFRKVPRSPFAYWVSDKVRALFDDLQPFENEERTARQGLATADDFRFLRLWWEAAASCILNGSRGPYEGDLKQYQQWCRAQTYQSSRWVSFAKGGTYSPFYADVHLLVDWELDGQAIRSFERAYIRNDALYFRPGLTWPLRTQKGLNFRTYPTGSIFAHKGPVCFIPATELWALFALLNATVFQALVEVQMAFGSYEVGVIQRTPIPAISEHEESLLKTLAMEAVDRKRNLDAASEISHVFSLPALLEIKDGSIIDRLQARARKVAATDRRLAEIQREIDEIAYRLYGLADEDRRGLETALNSAAATDGEGSVGEEDADVDVEDILDPEALVHNLISYALGCVFGRWDIRLATGERSLPELPDPFAPLPVCSPGMLQDKHGLPLADAPDQYPLEIDPGLLVDDPDHRDDIIRRIREVLALLFDTPDAIEHEMREILGESDLRSYFRKKGNSGFFMQHVRRYSKSRRKAPIYWFLQSEKKGYGIWLYYHWLNQDTLSKALELYVRPKLQLEENRLASLRQQREEAGTSGSRAKQIEQALDDKEGLLSELRDFKDKLERAAGLNLRPDLDDGVVLNIAPLYELLPWNEAEKYWKKLKKGEYAWSTISKQLRQRSTIYGH